MKWKNEVKWSEEDDKVDEWNRINQVMKRINWFFLPYIVSKDVGCVSMSIYIRVILDRMIYLNFFSVDVSTKNKLVIEKYNVCNFLLNTKMLENYSHM